MHFRNFTWKYLYTQHALKICIINNYNKFDWLRKNAITNQRVNVINIWIDSKSLSLLILILFFSLGDPNLLPDLIVAPSANAFKFAAHFISLPLYLSQSLCLCSLWLSVEKCQKQFIIVSCENAISNFTCTNGQLRCTHCTKAAKETKALAQNQQPQQLPDCTGWQGVEKVRVRTLVNCTICHCHRARLAFKNILRNYNVHVSH